MRSASERRRAALALSLAVAAAAVGCGGESGTPDGGGRDLASSTGGDLTMGDLVTAADLTAPPPDLVDPVACKAAFAGCADFLDATAEGASRVIVATSFAYTPKCLRVKVGQTVTFQGDLAFHPLAQACGPSVPLSASGGSERSFLLPRAGLLGYYCLDHGNTDGQAMAGAIEVVP